MFVIGTPIHFTWAFDGLLSFLIISFLSLFLFLHFLSFLSCSPSPHPSSSFIISPSGFSTTIPSQPSDCTKPLRVCGGGKGSEVSSFCRRRRLCHSVGCFVSRQAQCHRISCPCCSSLGVQAWQCGLYPFFLLFFFYLPPLLR